jgi:general stress protein 26
LLAQRLQPRSAKISQQGEDALDTRRNQGEGNREAARRYDDAASTHASTQPTQQLGRNASAEMDDLLGQLKHFDIGMMVTQRADGRRAARPMYVASMHDPGVLRFVTHRDAALLSEIEAQPEVVLTFQRGARYLSLTGSAAASTDPKDLARCWQEAFRLWFPEGKSSADAAVIRVEPLEAEYWDQTGLEGIRLLFQAARALIQREPLASKTVGKHGHVHLVASRGADA